MVLLFFSAQSPSLPDQYPFPSPESGGQQGLWRLWKEAKSIYQTLNTKKDKQIAKLMRMHQGYTYIMSASEDMIPYFSKAFNNPKDKFKVLGLPRIDYLLETSLLSALYFS